jgi:hypothetical protein
MADHQAVNILIRAGRSVLHLSKRGVHSYMCLLGNYNPVSYIE